MRLLNAKQAIDIAKAYVADIFGGEGAFNIGLEEITFDGDTGLWEVTIGFSRPWDKPTFQNALVPQAERRTYKVVDVEDRSGQVLSVRNRPTGAALQQQ